MLDAIISQGVVVVVQPLFSEYQYLLRRVSALLLINHSLDISDGFREIQLETESPTTQEIFDTDRFSFDVVRAAIDAGGHLRAWPPCDVLRCSPSKRGRTGCIWISSEPISSMLASFNLRSPRDEEEN